MKSTVVPNLCPRDAETGASASNRRPAAQSGHLLGQRPGGRQRDRQEGILAIARLHGERRLRRVQERVPGRSQHLGAAEPQRAVPGDRDARQQAAERISQRLVLETAVPHLPRTQPAGDGDPDAGIDPALLHAAEPRPVLNKRLTDRSHTSMCPVASSTRCTGTRPAGFPSDIPTPRRVTCSRITMRHTDITPLSWETRHFAPTAAAKRQLYRRSAVCRSHEQREKFSNAYQSCDTSKTR